MAKEELTDSVVREMIESDDPAIAQAAMEYQENLNKERGLSNTGRALARGAKKIGAGLLGIIDAPGAVYEMATGQKGYKPIGLAEKWIDEKTGNYTVPVTKGEKISDTAIESVASLPALGGFGLAAKAAKGGSKVAKFLKESSKLSPSNIAITAGSGAGSKTGQEYIGDSPLIGIGSGLIGGLGAGAALHGAAKLGATALKKATALNPKALRDYQTAGIPYGLADVSEARPLHMAKDALAHKLFAGKTMTKFRKEQMKAVKKGLGNLEDRSHEGLKERFAVKGVETGLKNRKAYFKAQYNKAKEALGDTKDLSIPLHEIGKIREEMGDEAYKQLVKHTKEGKHLKELLDIDELKNLSKPGYHPGLTHPEAKAILKKLQEKIANAPAHGNQSQGTLKHLSGTLKKDIESAERLHLGELSAASLEKLNDKYKYFIDHEKEHINKILKNANRLKTGNYSSIGRETEVGKALISDLKGDGKAIKIALDHLPDEEKGAFVESIMSSLGKTGGKGSEELFNASHLQTAISKLPSKTREELLSALYDKDRVTATLNAIKNSKEVLSAANHSGSAHHLGLQSDVASYLSSLKDAAASSKKGTLSAPFRAAGNLGLKLGIEQSAAKALTSPKLVDWMVRGGSAATLPQKLVKGSLGAVAGAAKARKPLRIEITEGTLVPEEQSYKKGGKVIDHLKNYAKRLKRQALEDEKYARNTKVIRRHLAKGKEVSANKKSTAFNLKKKKDESNESAELKRSFKKMTLNQTFNKFKKDEAIKQNKLQILKSSKKKQAQDNIEYKNNPELCNISQKGHPMGCFSASALSALKTLNPKAVKDYAGKNALDNFINAEKLSKKTAEGGSGGFIGDVTQKYKHQFREFVPRSEIIKNDRGNLEVGEKDFISPQRIAEALGLNRVVNMTFGKNKRPGEKKEPPSHSVNVRKINPLKGEITFNDPWYDGFSSKGTTREYPYNYEPQEAGSKAANNYAPILALPSGYNQINRTQYSSKNETTSDKTSPFRKPKYSPAELAAFKKAGIKEF